MTGNEVRNTLATNIKRHRAQKGFSQAQLAEKADISLPFLSSIEQSCKWPYPDTLAQIADALDIPVSDLFLQEERKNNSKEYALSIIKKLVDSQKKVLDDFGNQYLK